MSQHDSRLASKTRTRWRSGLAILSIGMTMAPAVARAQIDLKAAAAAIMAADRAFNQSVAARDRVKFLSFIVENATFVGASDMRGHDAILKGWESFFQKDGPTLTWEPTKGEVLVAGDVGYTVGSWVRRGRGPDGTFAETRGQYLTTWRKQKDGMWKIVYDIGSTAP
jgi:ketosteroid isomerase-like protein